MKNKETFTFFCFFLTHVSVAFSLEKNSISQYIIQSSISIKITLNLNDIKLIVCRILLVRKLVKM